MPPKVIQIKVKPNSRTSLLEQNEDGTWLAQIKSPPVDGKANEELIALVRTLLGDHQNAGQMLRNVRRGQLEIPSNFTLIIRVMVILSGEWSGAPASTAIRNGCSAGRSSLRRTSTSRT